MKEKELRLLRREDLQAQLRKMQEQGNSASAEIQIYTEYIEQLESVLSLSENDLNEAFYERVTKQIFVYPLNLLEFRLSFIPMPIYMQYKTSGRGNDYTAEFTILTKEQFAELLEKAPKNEIAERWRKQLVFICVKSSNLIKMVCTL